MLAKKCLLVGIFTLLNLSLAIAAPPAVHPTTGEPLVIDCLRGTPDAIDGDLSDWNLEAMTPAVLDVVEQLNSGQATWDGPEDCSGEFYLLWDDENIYIAAVVKDEKLSMNKTGGSIWNADAIEVFFSTTNAVPDCSEHYQYGFNANNQRWNWCNMDGAGSTEPDYLQIASSVTADGYICEASISYGQMLSLDFSAGNTIGFHPVFDDTDNGDTELQMTWTGREAHDQSLGFGHLFLSAETAPVVDMEIGFATQPPVIDGEVDETWADASTQYFVPLDDPANASGSWMALYDSENLYVIVDMTDDSLQNDSASSWQDDSVELYFDGGNTKVNTPLSGDDHQYTFGWTTDDIQGTNIDGATEGIEHAQVDTDTGWRIEIKLPWLSLQGAAPQAGDLIGIDCYYNDDDDGGDSRENKLLSFSAVEGWNDASQWGTAMLTAIPAPQPVDPGTDGLVAHYAFENDANDSSGNELHGTLVGDAKFAEGPADYGMALDLDGDGDYVDCGTPPQLDITEQITFTFWIKAVALDKGWNTVLSRGDDSWRSSRAGTDNFMEAAVGGTSGNYLFGVTPVDDDKWHHVGAVYDGATFYLYVDGELDSSEESTGNITVSSYPLFIGNNSQNTDREWTGLIDEVVIYNRALSEGEVMYLAGKRATPVDPGSDGLVAFYAFENDANDSSGNGNDGTIVGAPTFVDGPAGYGMAMEFHGLGAPGGGGDYIDCGNDVSLDITGPISMALWIRPGADDPEGQGTETAPMAKAMSGAGWSYQVRYGWGSPQPYMAFTFNSSPRAWAYVGRNLERDEWCHIACSHDGTTLKCYLNGEQTDSTPMGQITSSEAPVLIGSDGWGCDWIGAIDEVAIYNRDLSAGEVLYLAGFREMVDPGTENLVVHLTFDEGDGTIAVDSSPAGGNDGILIGTAMSWTPDDGMIGGALSFDGTASDADYVEIPTADISPAAGTVAMWGKLPPDPQAPATRYFFGHTTLPAWSDRIQLYMDDSDTVLDLGLGDSHNRHKDIMSLTTETWYHVALTWDGGNYVVYVDGQEKANGSYIGLDTLNPVADIGNDGNADDRTEAFNGLLDDVRIYNVALTGAEISYLAGAN